MLEPAGDTDRVYEDPEADTGPGRESGSSDSTVEGTEKAGNTDGKEEKKEGPEPGERQETGSGPEKKEEKEDIDYELFTGDELQEKLKEREGEHNEQQKK